MGHFIGMENRLFYVHDDGRVYDTPDKRIEFDPQTYESLSRNGGLDEGNKESLEPELEKERPEKPAMAGSATICGDCGFEAKNANGLRLHRMKKHGRK